MVGSELESTQTVFYGVLYCTKSVRGTDRHTIFAQTRDILCCLRSVPAIIYPQQPQDRETSHTPQEESETEAATTYQSLFEMLFRRSDTSRK